MTKVLFLDFNSELNSTKSKVYNYTLNHLATLLKCELYDYVDNSTLLDFIEKGNFTTVITTCEIPKDLSYLLKGKKLIQICLGHNKLISDIVDIIIDPLLLKSKQFLVGTRYLLPSVVDEFSKDEIAQELGISVERLTEDINHNQAEEELLNVITLYNILEWDSDFFEFNIAYISCLRLTVNIEHHVKDFIRSKKIDMIEYLCNCHDRESVLCSEKNGYSFVDMRLTFEQFLNKDINVEAREGYTVSIGTESDIDKLNDIATDIYKDSRYYFDDNFARDKVIVFYKNWIEKAIKGTFDDFAYVLYKGEQPIGFCSIRKSREAVAKIGVFGLAKEFSGQGLAKYLLVNVLANLKSQGVEYIEVVTQGRNYAAQRLYQKCGFLTQKTELWYHKWFH